MTMGLKALLAEKYLNLTKPIAMYSLGMELKSHNHNVSLQPGREPDFAYRLEVQMPTIDGKVNEWVKDPQYPNLQKKELDSQTQWDIAYAILEATANNVARGLGLTAIVEMNEKDRSKVYIDFTHAFSMQQSRGMS
jgi:hypothetical protein